MSELPLPKLGSLSSTLARANLRIDQVIETLPGVLDHIVHAADRKEWREVARLSQSLAEACQNQDVPLVSEAQATATTASEQGELQIKRSLLRLIGAGGRIRRQGNASQPNDAVEPE